MTNVAKKVNAVIRHIEIYNVTQANKHVIAATLWVAKKVEERKGKLGEKKEQWWKNRSEGNKPGKGHQ